MPFAIPQADKTRKKKAKSKEKGIGASGRETFNWGKSAEGRSEAVDETRAVREAHQRSAHNLLPLVLYGAKQEATEHECVLESATG